MPAKIYYVADNDKDLIDKILDDFSTLVLRENGLETIDFKVLYLFIRKSCVLRRNRYTSLSRYINQKDSLTAKNPYIYIYGFFAIA